MAALRTFDLAALRAILEARPSLRDARLDYGFNLLQFCCVRPTVGHAASAARQLKLAQWLVKNGFDARATYTFPAGADGGIASKKRYDASIVDLLKKFGAR